MAARPEGPGDRGLTVRGGFPGGIGWAIVLVLALAGSAAPLRAAEPAPRKGFLEWIREYPERFIRRIKKPKKKLHSPRELEALFNGIRAQTFNGNDAKRDEEVDISRPLKQAGLAVFDGQVGIVRTFLAFKAAEMVRSAGRPVFRQAFQKAQQVIGKMGTDHAGRLTRSLATSTFGQQLTRNLGAKSIGQFMARESNFALMAFIGVLINSAFYDGVDIDSFKDQVDAAAAQVTDHTYQRAIPGSLLAGELVNREMFRAFERNWNGLYQQILKNRSFVGRVVQRADAAVGTLGRSLSKAHRTGVGAGGKAGFGEKLGLVGVGEGTTLTLSGLAGRFVIGAGMATVGALGIDVAANMVMGMPDRIYLGGDRNNYYSRQELGNYLLQKTGNPLKDWWLERSLRLKDLWDDRIKWPIKTVMGPTSALVGAYLGSVAAGALFAGGGVGVLIGGTLVSSLFAGLGNFIGNWVATKLDRSKAMMAMRRANYERMITRELEETAAYREGRLDDAGVDRIARMRALDFEKIESTGYHPNRIFFVDELANVTIYQKDGYHRMAIPDAHGQEMDRYADIRWVVVDKDGWRAHFDIATRRMINVGLESRNNGRGIVFVDDEHVQIDGDRLVPSEEKGLYLFKNGVVMERKSRYDLTLSPEERTAPGAREEEWIVRSHGASNDLFVRQTGERFAFQAGAYVRVDVVGGGEDVASSRRSPDPLDPYAGLVAGAVDEEALKKDIVRQSQLALETTWSQLETSWKDVDSEEEFVELIQTHGLDGLEGPARDRLGKDQALGDRMAFLKARVRRFVERLGVTVGRSLSAASGEDLRVNFDRIVGNDRPAAPRDTLERYDQARHRTRSSTVWGLLSLLSTPDALTLAAFDPAFGRAR